MAPRGAVSPAERRAESVESMLGAMDRHYGKFAVDLGDRLGTHKGSPATDTTLDGIVIRLQHRRGAMPAEWLEQQAMGRASSTSARISPVPTRRPRLPPGHIEAWTDADLAFVHGSGDPVGRAGAEALCAAVMEAFRTGGGCCIRTMGSLPATE